MLRVLFDRFLRKFLLSGSSKGQVYSWGCALSGRLGNVGRSQLPSTIPTLVPIPSVHKVTSISSGSAQSAVTTGCFSSLIYYIPVHCRDDHRVFTWGRGDHGRLGLGDKEHRYQPTWVEGLSRIEKVSVGFAHMLALDGPTSTTFSAADIVEDGQIYSWGFGKRGRLGHGDDLSHYRPKLIKVPPDLRFVDIAAGHAHSLAISGLHLFF